jgi:sterol desaturase/sphingolipid hydroxylase (fatty acid hydroxylase superfamily)
VGPLGPLDLVFNTPANHRVHHHLEGEGQQRNFGAALIVWDRLFGTFVRGDGARVPVGVKGYDGDSVNPLAIQLEGLAKWWRREP